MACVLTAAVAGGLALAAPARASRGQEMILQDDPKTVFEGSASTLDARLARLKAMGVDRLRVSLFWREVAPSPNSTRRPSFPSPGAAFPQSYPAGSWTRFDRIVTSAARHGLGVLFTLVGPAPAWAAQGGSSPNVTRPSPRDFGNFVAAAGRRYSGSSRGDSGQILPRVNHWSIWNEPNFPSWLVPQWTGGRHPRPVSPHLYRGLVDAAWANLVGTGHGGDMVLLGETAPFGPKRTAHRDAHALLAPVTFIRELFCLSSRDRPFRGRSARRRGCPSTHAGRVRFASTHPGLFLARGFAHHPYTLIARPTYKGRSKTDVPFGALSRIGRVVDRAQRRWGHPHHVGIWVTEYGYQTRPDPFRAVPFSRQGAWMSWSEYLAFRNRRVASFAQFLLYDDPPDNKQSGILRWRTFQTGLLTVSGAQKPAFNEFSVPIFVSPRSHVAGRRIRVFGAYRPGGNGAAISARIEFARPGHAWHVLRFTTVTSLRNYWSTRLRVPGTGRIRFVWTDPGTGADRASRAVLVRN
jgi:hypothetical protein